MSLSFVSSSPVRPLLSFESGVRCALGSRLACGSCQSRGFLPSLRFSLSRRVRTPPRIQLDAVPSRWHFLFSNRTEPSCGELSRLQIGSLLLVEVGDRPLSRLGQISAPMRLDDGNVALPAMAFVVSVTFGVTAHCIERSLAREHCLGKR